MYRVFQPNNSKTFVLALIYYNHDYSTIPDSQPKAHPGDHHQTATTGAFDQDLYSLP